MAGRIPIYRRVSDVLRMRPGGVDHGEVEGTARDPHRADGRGRLRPSPPRKYRLGRPVLEYAWDAATPCLASAPAPRQQAGERSDQPARLVEGQRYLRQFTRLRRGA